MSKERLEVIEAKLIMAKEDSISSFTDDFLTDMEYLIDRVKEQAGRVQELEQELHFCQVTKLPMDSVEKYTEDLKKQNKRYREAIEVSIHNMAASDNLGVKFALGILEQALEEGTDD